jgi:hypothetical protein
VMLLLIEYNLNRKYYEYEKGISYLQTVRNRKNYV